MTTDWDTYEAESQRRKLAERTGGSDDPLASYETTLAGIAPFKMYYAEVLVQKGLKDSTLETYRSSFNTFIRFMEGVGRHPACPSQEHVLAFVAAEREKGHDDRTTMAKLAQLDRAYRWFAADPHFPHTADYNPFRLAREQLEVTKPEKMQHRTTVKTLRQRVAEITDIRDRAIIVAGLKLGLRGSEVRNIKLSEISLENRLLEDHYPEMGTATPPGRPPERHLCPASKRTQGK